MSFSYSGDPSTASLDKVRFLCGDTLERDPLLQDEEIDEILVDTPNVRLAAADACEAIAALFSRKVTQSNLGQSKSLSEKAKAYFEMAKRLRKRAWVSAQLFAGGLTISEKEALAEDQDAIQPSFRIGQDDNFAGPELNTHDTFGSRSK